MPVCYLLLVEMFWGAKTQENCNKLGPVWKGNRLPAWDGQLACWRGIAECKGAYRFKLLQNILVCASALTVSSWALDLEVVSCRTATHGGCPP